MIKTEEYIKLENSYERLARQIARIMDALGDEAAGTGDLADRVKLVVGKMHHLQEHHHKIVRALEEKTGTVIPDGGQYINDILARIDMLEKR